MDTDLLMVIGLVIGGISIPSILGAFVDGRVPRVAAVAAIISGGLIVYANTQSPSGYSLNDLPDLFVSVVGRYI